MEYQKFIPEGWENTPKVTTEEIEYALENNTIMQGLVTKCDSNYNLYVNLGENFTGIIPRDQIEAISIDETGFPKPNICAGKVNKIVQFKVKNIDNTRNLAILSRKAVGVEAIEWLKKELKEGEKVRGIVRNIRPYGAFVEIGGGIVGLLHIEDISVARIKSPEERFKVGQKINVMIKYIDRKNERVILSYKELLGTWEENIENYKEGMEVYGTIRETDKYKNGIFVELMPNLVGMADYKEGLEYGDKAKVYIKKIIPEKHKIKLTII